MRLGTAVTCGSVLLSAAAPAVSRETPDTFILAGQSNMSGRGALEELSPAERAPDPSITMYGNDARRRPALDPLDDAAGRVDSVSADKAAAVGPGLFFARAIRGARGRPVLLVPCAKGGSAIGRWAPGGGRDTLYGSCLARARETDGRIAGLLWYQGESDAEKPDAADGWTRAFRSLVAAWRRDLGEPCLPVVFVSLGDPPDPRPGARGYPSWAAIQTAQAGLAIPCAASVPAAGLPRNADGLHLSTAGQRVLGERLATARTGAGCAFPTCRPGRTRNGTRRPRPGFARAATASPTSAWRSATGRTPTPTPAAAPRATPPRSRRCRRVIFRAWMTGSRA